MRRWRTFRGRDRSGAVTKRWRTTVLVSLVTGKRKHGEPTSVLQANRLSQK